MEHNVAKDKTSQRWVDYFQQADVVDERAVIYARARIANGPETLEHTALMCDLDYDRRMEWRITPEQTQKGLNWLQKNRRRKILKNAFGPAEWRILDNFSRFKFVGLRWLWNRHSSPVYRVVAKNGGYFDYRLERDEVKVERLVEHD